MPTAYRTRLTGKQVQRIHMQLGRKRQPWPELAIPRQRGAMTAAEVMAAPAGVERDAAIEAWCASVWSAFSSNGRGSAAKVGRRFHSDQLLAIAHPGRVYSIVRSANVL